jgi:Relaxase/Mobilisation nuclease domain
VLAAIVPPTNDFQVLARYLVRGDDRPPHPDRVAWVLAHNLPTDDPEQAAALMAATAQRSARCRKAAYHAMIAWAPEERPSPEIMQEIAVKTLKLAGLAEHQALIMGHGDKPHRHLHMLINRVHPETGKAWRTAHDYALFDRIMRQLSEDYGFQYVPAHRYNPELTDALPKKPNKRATRAARRGAKTDRMQWSRTEARALGAGISERLDRAAGWDDVEAAFAEEGLTLEAKGTGLVGGTPASYVKFSALGLTSTAQEFEKRFGGSLVVHQARKVEQKRSWFAVDAVDIARFLANFGLADTADVRRAIEESLAARDAELARASLTVRLRREMRRLMSSTGLASPGRGRVRPKVVGRAPSKGEGGRRGR